MFGKCSVRLVLHALRTFQSHALQDINCAKNITKISRSAYDGHFRQLSSSKCVIQSEKLEKIEFNEFKKLLNKDNVVIIDVREPQELVEHGALPGALNIPLGEIETALKDLPNDQFLKKYGRAKPDLATPIVFSCMRGIRSEKAQIAALQLHYKNVKNYIGGWTEWAEKNQK